MIDLRTTSDVRPRCPSAPHRGDLDRFQNAVTRARVARRIRVRTARRFAANGRDKRIQCFSLSRIRPSFPFSDTGVCRRVAVADGSDALSVAISDTLRDPRQTGGGMPIPFEFSIEGSSPSEVSCRSGCKRVQYFRLPIICRKHQEEFRRKGGRRTQRRGEDVETISRRCAATRR